MYWNSLRNWVFTHVHKRVAKFIYPRDTGNPENGAKSHLKKFNVMRIPVKADSS